MRSALGSRATKAAFAIALLSIVAGPRLFADQPAVVLDPVSAIEARIDVLALYAERRVLPLLDRERAGEAPAEEVERAVARFEIALAAEGRRLVALPREQAVPLASRLRDLQRSVRHPRPTGSVAHVSGRESNDDETPGVGLVTGVVTEAATGEPIQGARVEILNPFESDTVGTFGDGTFSIAVSPGTYTLVVEGPSQTELLAELYDNLPCPNGAWVGCDPTTGTPVVVQGGSVTSGIDFALEVGGSIRGTVVEATNGEPLQSAKVTVFDADGDPVNGGFSNATWTDTNGEYSVDRLGTGDHYVLAEHFDHAPQLYEDLPCGPGCDPLTGTPVAVSVGAVIEGIDFALPRRGRIEGRLTDALTGQPIHGLVRVSAANGGSGGSEITDAEGRYVIGGLLPGAYYVRTELNDSYLNEAYDDVPCLESPACLTAATVIDLASEEVVSGIDFALRPLGRIAGRVTDIAGNPLSDTLVAITGGPSSHEQVRTNALGEFQTLGLLPGSTYRATTGNDEGYLNERFADVPCWPPFGCEPMDGTPITVALETVTSGVDFSLPFGNVLSGRLTEAGSGLPMVGEIYALTVESTMPSVFNYLTYTESDAAGYWTIFGLAPGDYRIHVSAEGHRTELWDDQPCVQHKFDADCSGVTGTPLVFPDPGLEIDGIDAALDRLGTISGRIVDAVTGAPLNGKVTLETHAYSWSAVAGFDGIYVSPLLPPDTYRLMARATGYLAEVFAGITCPVDASGSPNCSIDIGTPVPLGLSQNLSGIDFSLLPIAAFADGFESGDSSAWAAARP